MDVVRVANLRGYIGERHRLSHMDWSRVPAFAKPGITPARRLIAIEEGRAEIADMTKLLGG